MLKIKISIVLLILLGIALTSKQSNAQNNALDFDGTNDYVSCGNILPDPGSGTPFSAFTFEFWMKINSFTDPGYMGVFGQQMYDTPLGSNSSFVFYCGNAGSTFGMEGFFSDGTPIDMRQAIPFGTGVWKHVATTYDGTTMKMYVNGILTNSNLYSGKSLGNWFNFIIARVLDYSDGVHEHCFDGEIDEFRIWNDARTETEIRQNMYRELTDPANETNLIAYYKFNQTSGTSLTDSKGSYTGTLTDMTGNEWSTSPAMFGPKNALDFDGSNDYVSIPANASLNNDVFTVEFWVKLDGTPSFYNAIIDKGRYSSGNDWYFMTIHNTLGVLFGLEGVNEIWFGLNDLNWHHVVGTFDGITMKAYVDGCLQSSQPTGSFTSSTNAIRIGQALSGQNPSNVTIDEIRIWSDVRTPQEIRENMCKSLTGNEENLVAYYTFDNTSGTTLQDLSGNSNDGTLNGGPVWTSSTAFTTWLNTTSTSWSTTTNWSRGSVPGSSDNVGIINYTGGTAPILSGSPTLNNLVVDDDFTLSSGLTVNGNLILENDLELNGQTITLGSSGTLIEDIGVLTSSTGNGNITTTRSLNNINQNVGGLGAEITTTQDMGSTVITRGFSAQTGGGSSGIKRYYDISPANNSGLNATLVMHYTDAELNGITEGDLELNRSTDEGVTWTPYGGTVNTTTNTITVTGINAFSRWTGGDKNNPLPVELSSFTASVNKNDVTLNWSTAWEINNAGFDIERQSIEGKKDIWTMIGFVEGNGTTNQPSDYMFQDKKLQSGSYNYRLVQRDYNSRGVEHFLSNAVSIGIPKKYNLSQNYPNPFNPMTKISFELPCDSKVNIKIFDMLGREVATLVNGYKEAGYHTVEFDGSNLSSGMYFCRIHTENFEAVKKMLLVK